MDKPYFLTQENAILLEECEHAIGSHAGLYLVHGASGIGKTRLLQVLARERIDARVRWLDLADGDEDDGDLVDSSARIETVFANANPGDVIVVDHFERALKKSRHQLFLSWSTEGIDKHLGLVIGGHVESLQNQDTSEEAVAGSISMDQVLRASYQDVKAIAMSVTTSFLPKPG